MLLMLKRGDPNVGTSYPVPGCGARRSQFGLEVRSSLLRNPREDVAMIVGAVVFALIKDGQLGSLAGVHAEIYYQDFTHRPVCKF